LNRDLQGVSDQCLELYHHFSMGVDKCTPERVKPAPKRRRGESSAEWLGVCMMDFYSQMHGFADLIHSVAMVYYCPLVPRYECPHSFIFYSGHYGGL
jgi:hypothetical protein